MASRRKSKTFHFLFLEYGGEPVSAKEAARHKKALASTLGDPDRGVGFPLITDLDGDEVEQLRSMNLDTR